MNLFLQTEFRDLVAVIALPTQPSFYNYVDLIDKVKVKVK